MTTTVTITLVYDDLDASEIDALPLLMRDALGEFVSARMPEEAYVNSRYKGEGFSERFRRKKIAEVAFRTNIAEKLRRNVGLQMSVVKCECILLGSCPNCTATAR